MTMTLLESAHVLIVDDDPLAIRALAQVLARAGRLGFATDGVDALARVEADLPDLVLLDHEMSGLSGLDTCRELKRRHPDLPVVFFTGHADAATEVRALDSGAADFVSKPLVPEVVLARVLMQLRLKDYADRIRALSRTDPLTGLANRRVLDERLALECARAQRSGEPLAVLMLDIDHFKAYNDHHGHPAGDAALVRVALALEACLRRAGDLVARFGGEEFCVVLPLTDAAQAREIAGQLCQAVRDLALPHGHSPTAGHVTLSIGVATGLPEGVSARRPSDGDGAPTPADWVAQADAALYQAKRQGRDRVSLP
jgi:diguanylate cyclase (GGDEF)-like protein